MSADRHRRLTLQLAELVRDYQQHPPEDVGAALRELTHSAARFVPGAQSAGITVATRDGKVDTVSATHPNAEMIDELQRRYREGPCLSAAWQQQMMRIDDMTEENRWPQFCEAALRETEIRSILAFEIFSERKRMGALNFYADRAHAFDDDAAELCLILATHIALAWNMLAQNQQFRSALASRDVIGQAKGIIMERFSTDAVAAFELLRRLSQDSNTAITDVAAQLVRTAQPDP